jgi:type I site-specific restriction endonuclease
MNAPIVFGNYAFKTKEESGIDYIFDVVRKKNYVLTPEEWVRQHVIHYLIYNKAYPAALLSVEKEIVVNELRKRGDVVAYGRDSKPMLLVECKADYIRIDEAVIMQSLTYNQRLQVPYLWLTNGATNVVIDIRQGIKYLADIPDFL